MRRGQRGIPGSGEAGAPSVPDVGVARSLTISDEADRAWLSALFDSFSALPADLETLLAWRTKRSLSARPPGMFRLRRAQVAPPPR